jgi:hypothetical protein
MAFNLRTAKKECNRRPIDTIRSKCPELRLSDFGDMGDDEIAYLATAFKDNLVKEAVHGLGDWSPVGPNFNPYQTSPLVNAVPNFGGNHRKNFPGGGDHHTNDDSAKQKNRKGDADENDFDPVLKRKKLNDALDLQKEKNKGCVCTVRVELSPDEQPTNELAVKILGDKAEYDGTSVYINVDDFETALEIERSQRAKGLKVRIEQKNKENK